MEKMRGRCGVLLVMPSKAWANAKGGRYAPWSC
jgi:hypothetical protein